MRKVRVSAEEFGAKLGILLSEEPVTKSASAGYVPSQYEPPEAGYMVSGADANEITSWAKVAAYGESVEARKDAREYLVGRIGGKVQEAIETLVAYRDSQYMTAVGEADTARLIPASEALFLPGHDAFEAVKNAQKAMIAANVISFNQLGGHFLTLLAKNAIVILEQSRSQIEYAFDEKQLVAYIREAIERFGLNGRVVLHGDHIQYSEKLFKAMDILKKEHEKVNGKGSFKSDMDIDDIDIEILKAVQETLKKNAEEEHKVIEGFVERLIKAGFTSIAIDASTIYDEIAGEAVLKYYRKHGSPAEKLVVALEESFQLPLEWGAEFLKLNPRSEADKMRFEHIKNTVIANMTKRKRGQDEIDEVVSRMTDAFGMLRKAAFHEEAMPDVLIAYDKIMRELALATIAGEVKPEALEKMSEKEKMLLLPTSNIAETIHQIGCIDWRVKMLAPELNGRFGKEVEVGHVDRKVPNPRRGGKLEAKMTHPAAVEIMGEFLATAGLSFDLIATNNGSGHGTDYDEETLEPISQVGKISPWLTEELQQQAKNFGASIAQHGTTGSDMDELAVLAKAGVIKFNIATNYQQIILNVLSLLDDGLSPKEILEIAKSGERDALVVGLHEKTREKIMKLSEAFKKDVKAAELKPDDSLFVEHIKRTYAWGVKNGKIKDDSSAEKTAVLIAKEFKRVLHQMDKKYYLLGHQAPVKASSAGQELMNKVIALEAAFINRLRTPDGAATLTDEVLKKYSGDLDSILIKLSQIALPAGISRQMQEQITDEITTQQKLIYLAGLLGTTIENSVTGDIVLDTESIIKDESQRELIETIFSNDVIKGALEAALSKKTKDKQETTLSKKAKDAAETTARVLLLKDLVSHESALSIDKPVMLISNDNEKLKRFKNAKLLNPGNDVPALAVPYHIGLAATLLSLGQKDNKASIIAQLDRISIQLRGAPIDATFKEKLKSGEWDVFEFIITNLPAVEAADIKETDRRVRAAVAALIAA